MLKKGIILATTFILAFTLYSVGQEQKKYVFPPEQLGFVSELASFLELAPDKKRKELLLSFNNFISNFQLEENEWIEIAGLTNTLIKKGIKPYPQFANFLDACISFERNVLDRYSFTNWLSHIRVSLQSEQSTLVFAEELWNFAKSINLFNELYNSGSVKWTIQGSNFSLKMDTSLFLTFNSATIKGAAGNEESSIYNTEGKYYPVNKAFISNSGKIDWTTSNLNANEVFALLGSFQLNLSKSVYSVDSVEFYDTRYFDSPLIGRLDNKIATGMPKNRKGYPKFTSYSSNNQIKNLYPNMDYTGGYTLQGRKVIGADISKNKGTLLIYYDNKPQVRISTDHFVFTPEKAQGVNTEVSIYLDSDSIFHPGLSFQYLHNRKEMALIRDGVGLSNSRFFSTYHNLDLDVEMITWNPNDSIMVLSGMVGSLKNHADFESSDYYNIDRFTEIQLADKSNPLVVIKQCSEYYNNRILTLADLSKFMNKPQYLVAEMLLNVSFLGFVRYDTESEIIEVKQRCFDFLSKHAELQDYDIIRFKSDMEPPKPNAYLNLNSGSLRIDGVKKIDLSNERNVTAYPTGNTVEIHKNRKISFDGILQAGLARFYGTDFSLIYDNYEVQIDHIESIKLKVHVPVNGSYAETDIKDISSIIENTSGSVLIDDPLNKSGIKAENYPEYPIFVADTIAYVYYDQAFIQDGAYSRDNFYFKSDSLIIQGLNSIYLKDNLSFAGQFKTADIFPEIRVNLEYREDQSLGFETLHTPDSGYQVYGGKGRFYDEINMSNEGLMGNGILEYLGANIQSDKFLFLPHEMRSLVKTIDIAESDTEEGTPKTQAEDVDIIWKPSEDLMIAHQKDGFIKLYEGIQFDGSVFIEPDGLKGSGTLKMSNFEVESAKFTFFKKSFSAEEAKFSIPNDFIASNSTIHINIPDSSVAIVSQNENSSVQFPENKFKASFATVEWKIGNNQIFVEKPGLVSEHPNQKGLAFDGSSAVYDLNSYELDIDGIEFIDIADVRIFPGEKATTIRTNAFIDSLPLSTIVPRDTSIRHIINDAIVFLNSKSNYRASGNYTYVDKAQREFNIHMNNISVDQNGISNARGKIEQAQGFFISPEFAFQGQANLVMNEPLLEFDGTFQLSNDCTANTKKWIEMNTKIDPLSVIIPIDSLTKDSQASKIYSGFFLSNQPIELYSTFLGPHTRYSDMPIVQSHGFIQFDELTGDYRLASKEKLDNKELIEPEIKLDRLNCTVSAEGKLNLGLDLGQIEIEASGTAKHDLKNDSVSLSLLMGVDFFINEKAMEYMAKELNKYSQAQALNYSDPDFRRSLMFKLGSQKGQEILDQLSLTGGFRKLPDEFLHTIFFSHLDLKWNPERGSYQSVGKIGIGNILDVPINKFFNGKMEIVHRRSGDTFTLYIETIPGSYFFFTYSRGLMQVIAGPTFEKFNKTIQDTKEAKRTQPSSPGLPSYQYFIGQYRLVRNFINFE